MSTYLNIDNATLTQCRGYWTAREIAQQPSVLRRVTQLIDRERGAIDSWLAPLLSQQHLRIILTGAGTSAYIGETLKPHLTQVLNRPIEAISTTDFVSNPEQYCLKQVPTLLISFARSGNSPESVGAVELADQFIDHCAHLTITCNSEGQLAKRHGTASNSYCLVMPAETLDQSFAMTSSFTAMLLATLWIFSPDASQFDAAMAAMNQLNDHGLTQIKQLADQHHSRIIFLGSGGLKGIAIEAALKVLELTAGKTDCYAESPLGFRHGPKSLITSDTLILLFNSNQHTRKKYERDLYDELVREQKTPFIYPLNDDAYFSAAALTDVWLSFPLIFYCQSLAFYQALSLNISPDNPCPSGEVNRVVQGVTIYPVKD